MKLRNITLLLLSLSLTSCGSFNFADPVFPSSSSSSGQSITSSSSVTNISNSSKEEESTSSSSQIETSSSSKSEESSSSSSTATSSSSSSEGSSSSSSSSSSEEESGPYIKIINKEDLLKDGFYIGNKRKISLNINPRINIPHGILQNDIEIVSSNSNVISVEGQHITAVSEGSAMIEVFYSGMSDSIEVKCDGVDNSTPIINTILRDSELLLHVGETFSKKEIYLNNNSSDEPITLNSSDESILSIDGEGMLTANKKGTATLYAIQGEVNESCEVTVLEKVDENHIYLAEEEFKFIGDYKTNYTATVGNVSFETSTIADYGAGMQWCKTSHDKYDAGKMWNTTPFEKPVRKIIFVSQRERNFRNLNGAFKVEMSTDETFTNVSTKHFSLNDEKSYAVWDLENYATYIRITNSSNYAQYAESLIFITEEGKFIPEQPEGWPIEVSSLKQALNVPIEKQALKFFIRNISVTSWKDDYFNAGQYGRYYVSDGETTIYVSGSTAAESALMWDNGTYHYQFQNDFLENELTSKILIESKIDIFFIVINGSTGVELNAIVTAVDNG